MSETVNLGLPLIDGDQTQKHVTANESFSILDVLVMLTVLSSVLTTPPATPAEGQAWIVAASATGDWTGEDGNVAAWQDGQWRFFPPGPGWKAWDQNAGALVIYDGAAWNASYGAGSSFAYGSGTAALPSITFTGDLNTGIWRPGADQLGFATGGTNRMLLSTTQLSIIPTTASTSSTTGALIVAGGVGIAGDVNIAGRMGLGGAVQSNSRLFMSGQPDQLNSWGVRLQPTIQSTANVYKGFDADPATQAAAFTLAAIYGFYTGGAALGAGSGITAQYGFYVAASLTVATNNYGFYGNLSAATGVWNFYANGAAANYFKGITTFDSGTASSSTTTGAVLVTGGLGMTGDLYAGGGLLSTSASAGVGYFTGAGASVTQTTNRTTAVTINNVCGRIITDNTSLAAGATAKFTVNNSRVNAADVIAVSIRSNTSTDQTDVKVQSVAAGSFTIVVANRHAATAETGAIQINFAVVRVVVN